MSFVILGERRFAGGAAPLFAAVDGNDYFFCQWLHSIMHEDGAFPTGVEIWLRWCNIDTLIFVVAIS